MSEYDLPVWSDPKWVSVQTKEGNCLERSMWGPTQEHWPGRWTAQRDQWAVLHNQACSEQTPTFHIANLLWNLCHFWLYFKKTYLHTHLLLGAFTCSFHPPRWLNPPRKPSLSNPLGSSQPITLGLPWCFFPTPFSGLPVATLYPTQRYSPQNDTQALLEWRHASCQPSPARSREDQLSACTAFCTWPQPQHACNIRELTRYMVLHSSVSAGDPLWTTYRLYDTACMPILLLTAPSPATSSLRKTDFRRCLFSKTFESSLPIT